MKLVHRRFRPIDIHTVYMSECARCFVLTRFVVRRLYVVYCSYLFVYIELIDVCVSSYVDLAESGDVRMVFVRFLALVSFDKES